MRVSTRNALFANLDSAGDQTRQDKYCFELTQPDAAAMRVERGRMRAECPLFSTSELAAGRAMLPLPTAKFGAARASQLAPFDTPWTVR
jgi:hypothetical protein